MIFRLIISALPFFPLVYGNGKCPPAPQPASRQRSGLGQVAVPTSSLVPKLDYHAYKHTGHFVYESKVPGPIEIVFVGLPNGMCMFSVECQTAYQSNWFALKTIDEGPDDIIHEVQETGPKVYEHEVWVAGVRAACPKFNMKESDFSTFYASEKGDVEVFLEGKPVALNRTWFPLIPGIYATDDSNGLAEFGVKMHYNISSDGTIAVKLACKDGGDTGFKKYKLVGTRIGDPYMVKPIENGDTLEDLVDSLKSACPGASGEEVLAKTYQTVGFVSEDAIYVAGNFSYDILHRQIF
ncbi:hypothetical protein FOZ63_026401 [Perkinsus olseni]|uniref:Uncharacterized protein n=1 Tax=Perkinsus olseni TaxID=32597 RepID=A0A7J6RXP3_PEROL|nr:hypothetical protein FOZ63_026401 [Perkinsus olseni]